MRVAALILGLLASLLEFVISGVTSTIFVVGTALEGSPFGPNPGRSVSNSAINSIVLLAYSVPLASLIGGALAIKLPKLGGALMLASAAGLLFWLGINGFTTVPLACSGFGGVLALLAGATSEAGNAGPVQISNGDLSSEIKLASFSPADVHLTRQPIVSFNREKWNALVRYDSEIATIADKLAPLGQKWVDRFAADFLTLDDRQYLLEMVRKILSDARAEAAENERIELQREFEKVEQEKLRNQVAANQVEEERAQLRLAQERRDARRYFMWGTWPRRCLVLAASLVLLAAAAWGAWQHQRIAEEKSIQQEADKRRIEEAEAQGRAEAKEAAMQRRRQEQTRQEQIRQEEERQEQARQARSRLRHEQIERELSQQQQTVAPPDAPIALPTFSFSVCNKSAMVASIATMAHDAPGSVSLTVRGWSLVPTGQCKSVGKFTKGEFFAAAVAANGSNWGTKDAPVCVVLGQQFQRSTTGNYYCGSHEQSISFQRFDITSGQYTWNLN